MEDIGRGLGKRIFRMGKVNIKIKMAKFKLEFGIWAKELILLKTEYRNLSKSKEKVDKL
jgi:hypothetical protein